MTTVVDKRGVPGRAEGGAIRPVHWLLVIVWVLILSGLVVWRVWSLGSGAADLGFHVHALGAVARDGFAAPASWAGWSFMQDHFAPWLLPLAPLVATSWGGYVLVVAQVLCYGASILCVWRLLGRTSVDELGRRIMTLAYAIAPALTFPLLFDSHSNVMAVPFVVLLLEGLIFDRRRQALIAAIAACGLREDVVLLVGVLAIVYAGRRKWVWLRLGIPVVLAFIGWRLTTSGRPGTVLDIYFGYFSIIRDNFDIGGAIGSVAGVVWANGLILLVAIAIVLPWILLGRLSLRPMVALVLAQSPYILADSLITKTVGYQYWVMAPALMTAAAIDVKRWTFSRARLIAFGGWTVITIVGGPFVLGALGPGGITVSSVLRNAEERGDTIAQAHNAIACVPEDEAVALTSELTPLTGQFASVHLLPNPFAPAETLTGREVRHHLVVNPEWPEWIIAPSLPDIARHEYRQVEETPWLWRTNSDTPHPTMCPKSG